MKIKINKDEKAMLRNAKEGLLWAEGIATERGCSGDHSFLYVVLLKSAALLETRAEILVRVAQRLLVEARRLRRLCGDDHGLRAEWHDAHHQRVEPDGETPTAQQQVDLSASEPLTVAPGRTKARACTPRKPH